MAATLSKVRMATRWIPEGPAGEATGPLLTAYFFRPGSFLASGMSFSSSLEFPVVFIVGAEENILPHIRSQESASELEEERRLCYVGLTRAQRRIVLTSAARRRVYGDYQSTEPSRFIDEIPAELVDEAPSTFVSSPSSFAPFRASPYPRGGGYRGKAREEPAVYAYEDEDQSVPSGMKPGLRVRHPVFGVGTVLSVEPLDDDTKLVVRFNSVGQKTLRARYAKLEVA